MDELTDELARANILFAINTYYQGTKQQWAALEQSLVRCGITSPTVDPSSNGVEPAVVVPS